MKNISNDKKDFKLGGLYGSSSTYIVDKLTHDFDNVKNSTAISLAPSTSRIDGAL